HVDTRPGRVTHRHVDALARQCRFDGAGVAVLAQEGHDPALGSTPVAHGDAWDLRQASPQKPGQRLDALPDRLESDAGGVARGDTEADARGTVVLPVLEAPRVAAKLEGIGAGPGGGTAIDEGRLDLGQRPLARIQEARAARSTEELPPGGGEKITPYRRDIDGHLPDRLAGIEQVVTTGGPGELADRGCGIDQAAVGRDVSNRDQLDLPIHPPPAPIPVHPPPPPS